MTYRYFLFDWDGSLADTLPILFEGYKNVFAKYGIKATNEIIAKKAIGDWGGPRRLGIVDEEKFFGELEKEVLEKLHKAKLNPNVMEILRMIKEKEGRIGIVSASKKRWVKKSLRNNGLRDLIDVFLAKEDVEQIKPNPEGIFKALSLMGGAKKEAVMIGDNEKDVAAAKAAGIDSVLYFPKKYHGYYDEKYQKSLGATWVIEDFCDLEKILLS